MKYSDLNLYVRPEVQGAPDFIIERPAQTKITNTHKTFRTVLSLLFGLFWFGRGLTWGGEGLGLKVYFVLVFVVDTQLFIHVAFSIVLVSLLFLVWALC